MKVRKPLVAEGESVSSKTKNLQNISSFPSLMGIFMPKFNHRGYLKYYENLTNWLIRSKNSRT